VAAGGARYLHSVRAFYLSSWKTLRAADNQFWNPYDKGWAPHLIFGREFSAVVNHPNIGVRSTWLQPNVGPRPILDVPASEVTRDRVKRCGNAIGIHSTICEYVVTNPTEGRRFFHRLENAPTFRVKLLGRNRDLGHMVEYRELLQSLGCPDANPTWAQSEFATRFISRKQRAVERYQTEMAENRSTRRRLRREQEDQGEESAPRRVRYEGDPELMEDSGPSTSAPAEPEEEPMETAPSARSPDRASPPPLIDLELEPELPPSPRLIPEIERFMSSQPIFEDISEDESTPGTLPDPSILDESIDDDTPALEAASIRLGVAVSEREAASRANYPGPPIHA
jgi:hypothetical protein